MKKAIIVGDSNGIGLAIGDRLIAAGYHREICLTGIRASFPSTRRRSRGVIEHY